MDDTPRIAPVPPAEWTDEIRSLLGFFTGVPADPAERQPNLMTVMARHPDLMRAYLTFGEHILRGSTLPHRDREIATLRIAWVQQCDYEWMSHMKFVRRLELLTDAEVEAIKAGSTGGDWPAHERALMAAAEQLIDAGRIDDATYAALAGRYDERQMLDLVFTIGNYVVLGWIFSVFRIPADDPTYASKVKFRDE